MKKNGKKVIALGMALLLGIATPCVKADITFASQVERVDKELAKKVIETIGVTDTKKLQNKVTRAEFAKILVNSSNWKDMVGKKTPTSIFSDVKSSYWAAPYIKVAIEQGLMSGNLQGRFRPNDPITLQEAVVGIVRLLGYENSDLKGNKNSARLSLYYGKKLDKGITKKANQVLVKGDVIQLIYNLFTAKTKDGTVYGEQFKYPFNSSGDIDYLAMIDDKMKGPFIAKKDWKKQIPFPLTNIIVYRDNKRSNVNKVQEDDVLYYSKELKTIWAYKNKVTGEYEKALPDQIQPKSIIIDGKEYGIGTQKASYELSTMGKFSYGDRITILFGKDDKIAGVKAGSSFKQPEIEKEENKNEESFDSLYKKIKGPIVAKKDWKTQIPFELKNTKIYRDNKKSNSNAISEYDVLYYSKALNTIWAYTEKVTGEYEKALPDQINPKTIVVSGKEYTVGTDAASYALSVMGNFSYNDRITLLFGKENTVVGLKAVEEKKERVGGIIMEKGERESSKKDEGATIQGFIRVIDAKGEEHVFDGGDKTYTVGKPVEISYWDKKPVISEVELYDLSGHVSDNGEVLGNRKFANNVNILEYHQGVYKKIKPRDLAGINLYQGEIKYYRLDENGEISELIVSDVTGKLYEYGILMKANEGGTPFQAFGEYTYEINGTIGNATTTYQMLVNREFGPARFYFDSKKQLAGIRMLSSYEVRSMSETEVSDSRGTKKIPEDVIVYLIKNGSYYRTSLSKISDVSRYKITAYYDNYGKKKDTIRIIVAREKTASER